MATLAAPALMSGCRGGDSVPTASASQSASPTPGKPLPSQPPTHDGRVALQRMVAAYKAFDSLQVETAADIQTSLQPSLIHQETVIKYRKQPPCITMTVKDPHLGTQQYFTDRGSIVHYTGVSNEYTQYSVDVQTGLKPLIERIDKDTPQVMSPLVFLQSKDIPLGVGSARLTGTEGVNGRRSYVVTGRFRSDYLSELAKRVVGIEMVPTKG